MSDPSTTLGVRVDFGLGQAWPDLKNLLDRLYGDRAARIPWLPKGWLQSVRDLQAANPTNLIRVTPGVGPLSPVFCDTEAKKNLWQELYKATDAAVFKYAQGKLAEGKADMEAAYADSDFWNRAYSIAVYIRDLPANAVGAVLDGAGDVAGGLVKKLLNSWIVWLILIAIGAYAAWRLGFLKLTGKG